MMLSMLAALPMQDAEALSPDVVISQVYGGGNTAGAPYTNDFVELFNRGTVAVSLNGMSIQYASATGTGNFGANPVVLLSGILAPGQYHLVQQAGGPIGVALPVPDATGAVSMSGTAGKVALVASSTGLACNGGSTPCDLAQLALIKDLVGYGAANFYENAAAAVLSNGTAALRLANGCTETDNNFLDFAVGAPTPRNSASPLNPCSGSDAAPTVAATFPANGATDFPLTANLSVTFSEPVNVSGTWFQLSCSVSGPIAATVSGGPMTFTLDPAVVLAHGETCTLTVLASQVSDQDAIDPPDSMATNLALGFTASDPCAAPFTPIYTMQGSGLSTPMPGMVTTKGVVVGDFEGSTGLQGFYLQDLTGDGDPATSDGIFVFTGNADLVSAGTVVRVTGYARERINQTTINGSNSDSAAVPAASIVSCGTGSVTPTDVVMPFADANYLERFEGMLVRFPQALVIAEHFNYDRFGELVIALPLDGETRPFTGTAIEEPGANANARTLANSLRRINLDDGLGTQNPGTVRHPNGAAFSLGNRFRGGDILQNTVGALGQDATTYRIQPTGPANHTATNSRPGAPAPVGGTLRVAAMNTLNFFLTLDRPAGDPLDNTCGPLKNVECRGADSDQPTEFTRQRTKLIAALAGLDADVIGLSEIENTLGVEPLADIVAGLPGYAYVDTGLIGADAIRVGLLYRPAKVVPVGAFKILDSTVDPRFLDTKNRPTLAQTFQSVANGSRFTVVVNHFKSKGSPCDDVGDLDAGDGQGNCNATRTLAARALVDWLATDPTGSGDPDFLILGDLNSYAREDPIHAIKQGADDALGTGDDYTNLIARFEGDYAYSYTFDGQAGYLDHALVTPSLLAQVTGATHWHINSDEPDVLDYDTSFKPAAQDALYEPNAYRSSDHDAVVVGLNVSDAIPPTLQGAVSRKTQGNAGTFDLPLNALATEPTTEPRSGGASGNHSIVFVFDKAVTGGTASVTAGTGTAGTPSFSGNAMVVPLTGVANQQYVTVSVSNVTAVDGSAGGSGSVRVGFLLGDANGNRVVTVSDLAQVNAQIAQLVTASNYLKDVNASGTLTVADKGIANAQITKALPAP